MTSKLTREQLYERARENVKALKMASRQTAFESARKEILADLQLAEIALAAMDSKPVAWGNGCDKTVPAALRYLAENERPFGGESRFNAAHLYQLAREIELMAEAPLYRHAQPAKGLELAGWQFKSVNGDWLGLIDEHGKNQAVRDGYEVREVFAMADSVNERDKVRRDHAEWSQATFGDVGPIGPLKHLSKEALEAAADPHDPLEWADMQFLFWDAQRRMGISDEFITRAMVEKLAINKARQWPEPKDGEPRLHIKEQPAPVVPDEMLCEFYEVSNWPDLVRELVEHVAQLQDSAKRNVKPWEDTFPETLLPAYIDRIKQADDACRAAMLNHPSSIQPNTDAAPGTEIKHPSSNSPVIPEGYVMVPKEPTAEMIAAAMNCEDVLFNSDESFCVQFDNIYEAMLAAADCSIPMISDRWIPVSERMPETDGNYWGWWSESKRQGPVWFIKSELQAQFQSSEITHWMPLPAAPQEVPDGKR